MKEQVRPRLLQLVNNIAGCKIYLKIAFVFVKAM